jgi:catechol 2,3-dioxygenase-like lactoylglutathione lyase family enzyme
VSRIDHVAVESPDPEATAAFYERVFGAHIVKTEGHPVMAYLDATGIAVHEPGGPGPHTAVRVTVEEQMS